ncbi:hypothetical protein K503DRAFT_806635 [Rhizopogon vinicolor AM-OR11-026]|uniref:Uncharacterized protein n=1 Tax=Rhizopogon vinicolor AM-OR11-026 TaxID=1314800 RepID=A0A1B7ME46_9AGAM|nr:hypothetical protein K503DRAFT_806635 [Rhizopogon vinicolor AM-OR11-026]
MDTFTIADLRKEDVAKQFGTISTLYIPPRDEGHVNLKGHKKLHASAAMKKFMTDLALKPKFLEEYKFDPVAVVERL